jgi:hypothetical protein
MLRWPARTTGTSSRSPGGSDALVAAGRLPADLRIEVTSLLEQLESVSDPRSGQGVRYRLPTLLAIMVCATTGGGHDSFTAIGEWCQRTARQAPNVLERLGVPRDPFSGRLRVPDEKTFRDVAGGCRAVTWVDDLSTPAVFVSVFRAGTVRSIGPGAVRGYQGWSWVSFSKRCRCVPALRRSASGTCHSRAASP